MDHRILSVWLPSWPVTRLSRVNADTDDAPLATVQTQGNKRRLVCVGPQAQRAGLRAGQALTQAQGMCPGLVALNADPESDAQALHSLADECLRYTPLVATDIAQDHGLWLDIAGCAHRFGGETGLMNDLATRLARRGVPSRMAVASTTGAAWALARSPLTPDHAVLDGDTRAALRDVPVAALRLDDRCVAGLRRLGLRTVGELCRLPRGEITARFGTLPVLRLDQALGHADEAIAWRQDAPDWSERLDFAEPIGTADDLARALTLLARRLCGRLAADDLGARRLTAWFFRLDASAASITVATGQPGRDASMLARLMREKLETVDPGFGVETMVLDARDTAPLAAPQTRIADLGAPDIDPRVGAALDIIANRIGADRIWRPAPRGSHVPERAVGRHAAAAPPPDWSAVPPHPRPVRLLRRPEPITAVAILPDDPPHMFVWRGVKRTVRAVTGPERIAAEWWTEAAPDTDRVRDYYQVEDSDGARFWVFRAGLHGGGRGWYLHGVFA